ncbi:MAG: response regulator transcription factor [Candidatus Gracilibacteria bacterium]|nr:response regulator transcription factor [Candidatus Gracilibacteria bacterium]
MRILIVDDDARILSFLRQGLESLSYMVEFTTDAQKAFMQVGISEYDLIILDINLRQDIDGMTICKKVRDKHKACPILMLSVLSDTETKKKCFECGADDYMIKPFDFEELAARVKALLRRRERPISSDALQISDLKFDLFTRDVTRNEKEILLTPVESILLEFLMKNAHSIVRKEEILQQVWNLDYEPETNLLEANICTLRKKIDRDFMPKLLHTIYGFGYLLGERV